MAYDLSQDVFDISSDFYYRGEGNANLVIGHKMKNIVHRFRKSLPGEVPVDGGLSRVVREQDFLAEVMLKFLGTYIDIPKIVHYDTENLEKLLNKIRSYRPPSRSSKSALERYATQLPDYTHLPKYLFVDISRHSINHNTKSTFCIEIKPKQGHVCKAAQYFSKCPYCLKQFYKTKMLTHEKMVKTNNSSETKWCNLLYERNKYCPFELFSGHQSRMKKAIMNLIGNPQNNLKIFKHDTCILSGDRVEYDQKESVKQLMSALFPKNELRSWEDLLSTLLVKVLLHPFIEVQNEVSDSSMINNIEIDSNLNIISRIDSNLKAQADKLLRGKCQDCNFSSGYLPQGSILDRILQIQKLHQHSDDVIYSIYSKYRDVLSDEIMHSTIINRFQDQRKITLLKSLETSAENERNMSLSTCDELFRNEIGTKIINDTNSVNSKKIEHKYPSPSELNILQNYLLFITIRDCSIMIAIQRIDANDILTCAKECIIELTENMKYLVNVKVSDIDLKSIHCIEKHRKRDEQILNTVISTLTEKPCESY